MLLLLAAAGCHRNCPYACRNSNRFWHLLLLLLGALARRWCRRLAVRTFAHPVCVNVCALHVAGEELQSRAQS